LSLDLNLTFPLAYGLVLANGLIKQRPEDFIVDEQLSFELTGSGEHVYLRIRKRQANTQWVVKQLARQFGCLARDIGYAGLKDRQALTTQWFSLPAKAFHESKATRFACEGVEIIEVNRHSGKLRRGAIKQNAFDLLIRDVVFDPDELTQRMTRIASQGVPNYFGEQRFGIRRQNLQVVDEWFGGVRKVDRFKRSLYLSAARSWLFNLVLAERVHQATWCEPLTGDVYLLEGSKRFFYEPQLSEEIMRRVQEGDIHPSAPLWGEGVLLTTDAARLLEETVLSEWPAWRQGLQCAGLKQQRRATRVIPRELFYTYDETQHTLRLGFALPAGCYATGLLRELIAFPSDLSGEFELTDE